MTPNHQQAAEGVSQRVWIDPRTQEPCKRCDGTGKMPPWPGSKGLVACGVCRETEVSPPAASPEQEELCDVCHQPLEFPADDDPRYEGDTAVTSKCRHMIRSRGAEQAPVDGGTEELLADFVLAFGNKYSPSRDDVRFQDAINMSAEVYAAERVHNFSAAHRKSLIAGLSCLLKTAPPVDTAAPVNTATAQKMGERFHDDTTPLPCGCPTFYLYVRENNVFCGKCGDHYSHPKDGVSNLPPVDTRPDPRAESCEHFEDISKCFICTPNPSYDPKVEEIRAFMQTTPKGKSMFGPIADKIIYDLLDRLRKGER